MHTQKADEVAFRHREVVPPFDFFESSTQHPQCISPAVLSDISTAIDFLSAADADDERSDRSLSSDNDEDEFAAAFPTLASFFEKKRLKKLQQPEYKEITYQAESDIARRTALVCEEAVLESEDETEHAHCRAQ